jgi:hypothetical protein
MMPAPAAGRREDRKTMRLLSMRPLSIRLLLPFAA